MLAEYRNAIAALEKQCLQIQVEGLRRAEIKGVRASRAPGEEPVDREMTIAFSVSGDSEKYSLTNGSGEDYVNRVFVRTPTQEFGVRRNSPTSPYYLELEEIGSSKEMLVEDRKAMIAKCKFCVACQMTWPSKVRSSSFKVKSASREPAGDRSLYRIAFHYEEAKREEDGWFRVDPQADWQLLDYSVKTKLSGPSKILATCNGSVDYRSAGGSLVPSRITYQRALEISGRLQEQTEVVRITKWDLAPTPPEEFSLAFYGLGDFSTQGGRSTNWFAFYAFGAAILAGAMSLVLAKLARRNANRRPGGSQAGPMPGSPEQTA